MIGATSKARLYLKYFQNLAEKTDLGRLACSSLLRFGNEAISSSTRGSQLNGKMSAKIWEDLEQTLEKGSSVFSEPSIFGCYFVMDPNSPTSMNSVCPIIDTAVMNPPFGTRKKGVDMDFLFATLKAKRLGLLFDALNARVSSFFFYLIFFWDFYHRD
ncbi:hypothetical protein CsSME_00019688 [Camellia sinensis var. sinensis]